MALHNPSNLYAGNAVTLDSKPFTDFAINQLAQKQAQNEALDKYFAERAAKITSTGMRDQELPALAAKQKEYQDFSIANTDAIHDIKKDGGAAYGKAMQMQNEMQQIVNESKIENKTNEQIKTIYTNPETNGRIKQSSLTDIHSHGQPIYKVGEDGKVVRNDFDPISNVNGHKHFDISSLQFDPKDWGVKEWDAYNNNFGRGIKPDKSVSDIKVAPDNPYDKIVTTTQQHSPDNVRTLINQGLTDYNNNDGMQHTYDKQHTFDNYFMKDANGNTVVKPDMQNQFDAYNKIFKIAYPDRDIKTMGELHAAMTTAPKIVPVQTQQRVENWAAKNALTNAEQNQRQASSQSHAVSMKYLENNLINARKNGDQTQSNKWIENMADNAINEGQANIEKAKSMGIPNVKFGPISMGQQFQNAYKQGSISPMGMAVTPEGKIVIHYPEMDVHSNPTGNVNPAMTKVVSKEQLMQDLGHTQLSKKEQSKSMNQYYNNGNNTQTQQSSKPTTAPKIIKVKGL